MKVELFHIILSQSRSFSHILILSFRSLTGMMISTMYALEGKLKHQLTIRFQKKETFPQLKWPGEVKKPWCDSYIFLWLWPIQGFTQSWWVFVMWVMHLFPLFVSLCNQTWPDVSQPTIVVIYFIFYLHIDYVPLCFISLVMFHLPSSCLGLASVYVWSLSCPYTWQ